LAVAIGLALTRVVAGGGTRTDRGVLAVPGDRECLWHLLGSVYAGRRPPGFWSSPWLLVTSVWMVARVVGGQWDRQR
jgi:hypothetical protein